MGDLDALALAEKEDRVIADDVAAAHRLNSDLGVRAWAHVALARVPGVLCQIPARGLGEGLG
jgi:hypothetical protein